MACSLGLTPDGGWTASLEEQLAVAAAAGFDALGLSGAAASDEARAQFAAAGLRCDEVLALVVTEDADAVQREAERLAGAARLMGAPFVLTVYATELNATSSSIINRAASTFAAAGAKMACEFSPLGPISTLALAREVVGAAGGPAHAGVMIDSWHFLMGASRFEDLETIPLDHIAYVQFSDALAPESEKLGRETMKRRTLPGHGILELDRFAAILCDRGYEGLVSLEILSESWRQRSLAEFAVAAYEAAAPYWR